MNALSVVRRLAILTVSLAAGLLTTGVADAYDGGRHAVSSGFAGARSLGGGHGYVSARGVVGGRGFVGGHYGGYGYRRGGYYGGWGLGYGLGYGLLFATLPYYYSTYWWNDVPYYYADGAYYRWNGSASAYETVRAPAAGFGREGTLPVPMTLYAYPMHGQSDALQASDRAECRNWAAQQTATAPATPGAATPTAAPSGQDAQRAETACLQGRGYSVQ